MGINIRVVKYNEEFIKRAQLKNDKNVFLTEGYTTTIEDCIKKIRISFCPFCGKDLEYLVKSDEYVQEIY